MTRKWYEKYIGYSFNYNGREVILDDVFYYEDDGKVTGTGYGMHYADTKESFICDYKTFKRIADQTNLPK